MIVLIVLPILLSKFPITPVLATTEQSSTTFVYGLRCNGTFTPQSLYQYSLYNLLGILTTKASSNGYYSGTYGSTPNQAFALFCCRGDIDGDDCSYCVNTAKNKILQKCPYQTQATILYDHCILRFSNESFFGKNRMAFSPRIKLSNSKNLTRNETSHFAELLRSTMNGLAVQAAGDKYPNRKWATTIVKFNLTSFSTLYALAQCTPELSYDYCVKCLNVAAGQLPVSTGAWLLQPFCVLRYENHPFFNQTVDYYSPLALRIAGKRHHSRLRLFVAIFVSITTTLLGVGILIYMRKEKAKSSLLEIDEIKTVASLQFELSTIRLATRNFSLQNKLGKGGFGEVYKGKLENGQEVAIKRLSKSSGQGIEEFKTEVGLVAKLQHKNLVTLLGFCLDSTEKILIYEFLQNSSLDKFLFDATKKVYLDWTTRFKIIVGIARGLLYLHEESRHRVIHRDLKPSNILLDGNMNPKISDFGLARLFGVDQTQDDTKRIVGTYGYMAPEYAMTGHFSVKSDVYSFGIIILEIVTGQRNGSFYGQCQTEEALLYRAWRLWNEGKALDLVDIASDKYSEEEVMKCIHIALMCIQENAAQRPRMATVVTALTEKSIILPMPKAPNFVGNIGTNEEIISADYNGIQVPPQQFCSYEYTGSEKITELYPRP